MVNKELGQHWLYDARSLDAVVLAAGVTSEQDVVLEVGPGLGTLTRRLLATGASVIAVEFDEQLVVKLAREFSQSISDKQLTLHHGDILKLQLDELPAGYKVAANIPYYLTSHLLRRLSESSNPPQQMALLMQKEVAERVAAAPGDMSLLSVSTQLYYQPSLGVEVPAELFSPPPKVDSQILQLIKHAEPLFPGIEYRRILRVAKAGFSERRKKLRSSLSGGLAISVTQAEQLCAQAGVDANLRAQALSLQQWARLAEQLIP